MSIAKRVTLILIGLLFILVLVLGIEKQQALTAKITVEVVPSGSSLKLDGKGRKEGTFSVAPGTHTVSASRDGFAADSKKITVDKGQDKYIGITLASNSPSSADWYIKRPEDSKKVEGISSRNFDQSTLDTHAKNPFTGHLPYIDRYFRIDYGEPNRAKDKTNSVAIYIRASSAENRQMALSWIRQQGFDPTDYEIVFKNFTNPFGGQQ